MIKQTLITTALCCIIAIQSTAQTEQTNYRTWEQTNQTSSNDKIALVIGNSQYLHTSSLREPANDAETIAAALTHQGYKVSINYNLDQSSFYETIDDFAKEFARAKEGIIYFAGHGFQVDGVNYLAPTDANPNNSLQVQRYCIDVKYLLRQIDQPKIPKVILFDACRNNPFASTWTDQGVRSGAKGMKKVRALTNSLVIFSTVEGNVVRDDNLFAESLAKHIKQGGCFSDILGRVDMDVHRDDPSQLIRPEGLLRGSICFGSSSTKTQKSAVQINSTNNHNTPSVDIVDQNFLTNMFAQQDRGKTNLEKGYWYLKKRDFALAEQYLLKAFNEDQVGIAAYFLCVIYYISNKGSEKKVYAQKAVNAGFPIANFFLENYDKCLVDVAEFANMGDSFSQNNLGYMYGEGYGVDKNYGLALQWYRKAAEQNLPNAQSNLGYMYLNGYGVDKNYELALQWYRKAAEQNLPNAQSNLGYMYQNGYGVDKNYELALQWYRKAAEQNFALAQKNLGDMYYNGYGVDKNYNLAVEWYRKAAEQNLAVGQNNLGHMYQNGYGVDKNYELALQWYRKAAEQNFASAQNNLAYMYKKGYGVDINYNLAFQWYRKAAEQNFALAQKNLGDMYYNGYGVDKNYNLAVEWYRKAAKQGNTKAQKNLERFGESW